MMPKNGMELLDTYISAGGIGWLINDTKGMVYGLVGAALIRIAGLMYLEMRKK